MKRLVVSLFCLLVAASSTYGEGLNYQETATAVQDALRQMDYAVLVDVKRCDKNAITDYIVAWFAGRLDEKYPFLGAVTGVVAEVSEGTTWKSDKVFAAITTRDFVMRRWYASTADCRKCRRMIDKGASLEEMGLCIKSIWHPSGAGCPPTNLKNKRGIEEERRHKKEQPGAVGSKSYFKKDAREIDSFIDGWCYTKFGRVCSNTISIGPSPSIKGAYSILIAINEDSTSRDFVLLLGILAVGKVTAKTKWKSDFLALWDLRTDKRVGIKTKRCRKAYRMWQNGNFDSLEDYLENISRF